MYLGDTEIRLDTATGTKTSTRHYSYGGQAVAVRTSAGVQIVAGDQHKTATYAIHASTGALTTRRMLPFGGQRTEPASAWPGERGYVNGTQDSSTGLTQLGVRAYDPDTGRFTTVDPILSTGDPQQWNAYAYANNSPITNSDPDGLEPFGWHNQGAGGSTCTPNSNNYECGGTSGLATATGAQGSRPGGGRPRSVQRRGRGSRSPSPATSEASSIRSLTPPLRSRSSCSRPQGDPLGTRAWVENRRGALKDWYGYALTGGPCGQR